MLWMGAAWCLLKLKVLFKVKNKLKKGIMAMIFRLYLVPCSSFICYTLGTLWLRNENDNKWKILFTDTESLMYEIKTEDVYEDFSGEKEIFDFSNHLS